MSYSIYVVLCNTDAYCCYCLGAWKYAYGNGKMPSKVAEWEEVGIVKKLIPLTKEPGMEFNLLKACVCK